MSAPPAVPRWTVSDDQRAALALVAAGLAGPARVGRASLQDPLRPVLAVDAATAEAAEAAGRLVLADAEGTPLAEVVVTGTGPVLVGDPTGAGLGPTARRIDGELTWREVPGPDRPDPDVPQPDTAPPARADLGHLTQRSLHGPDIAALVDATRRARPAGADRARLLVVVDPPDDLAAHVLPTAVRSALATLPTDVDAEVAVHRLPPVTDPALAAVRRPALLAALGAAATTAAATAEATTEQDHATPAPAPDGPLPRVPLDAAATARGAALAAAIRDGDDLDTDDVATALPAVLARLRPAWPLRRDRGAVVLFTGLSGSGKSTIARALRERLVGATGRPVTLLDGDLVRRHLSSGLGFSREDRDRNVARIGFVAAEIARHGGLALCAPIAPFDAVRREVRARVTATGAGFVLVHVATDVELCAARDTKGLYARAAAGSLTGLTGVDDPYEVPTDAEVVVDTAEVGVDEAVERVVAALAGGGWWATGSLEVGH